METWLLTISVCSAALIIAGHISGTSPPHRIMSRRGKKFHHIYIATIDVRLKSKLNIYQCRSGATVITNINYQGVFHRLTEHTSMKHKMYINQ